MKKLTCIIITFIFCVFFSACNKSGTNKSTMATNPTASFTATDKQSDVATTDATNQNINELEAKKFLDNLKSKNINKIIRLIGAVSYDEKSDAEALKAYSFLKEVTIDRYAILERTPLNDSDTSFKVSIHITKSKSALFPVGESKWTLNVGGSKGGPILLFKLSDKSINILNWDNADAVVRFCTRFSAELGFFKQENNFNDIVPDVKDKAVFTSFCDDLIRFLPVVFDKNYDSGVKIAELEKTAENCLGITGVDFKKSAHYNKANDIIEPSWLGGSWYYCTLESKIFHPETKRYTVIIDYYSDNAYILKAKTVEYLLRENNDKSFRLFSTRLLFNNNFNVAGWTS